MPFCSDSGQWRRGKKRLKDGGRVYWLDAVFVVLLPRPPHSTRRPRYFGIAKYLTNLSLTMMSIRIEKLRQNCEKQWEAHWQCLDKSNQMLEKCRPAERVFNDCVFQKLVRVLID